MNGRIKQEKVERLPYPIIGRVGCGYKDERGIPRSTDHFIPKGKYAKLFTEAYGENPDVIQVIFPTDNASLVCREEYEFRDGQQKLIASGDGETFKVWSTKVGKQGAYITLNTNEHPNLMEMIKSQNPKYDWKVTLTLNFIIPKIRGVMGLWQFTTKGSASTIPQVRDAFDAMIEENGRAAGVIFDLSIKIHESNHPGMKSRYPVIMLVPNESESNLKMVMEARKPINLIENSK